MQSDFFHEIYSLQLVFLNISVTKASFLIPLKDNYFSIHYLTLSISYIEIMDIFQCLLFFIFFSLWTVRKGRFHYNSHNQRLMSSAENLSSFFSQRSTEPILSVQLIILLRKVRKLTGSDPGLDHINICVCLASHTDLCQLLHSLAENFAIIFGHKGIPKLLVCSVSLEQMHQ